MHSKIMFIRPLWYSKIFYIQVSAKKSRDEIQYLRDKIESLEEKLNDVHALVNPMHELIAQQQLIIHELQIKHSNTTLSPSAFTVYPYQRRSYNTSQVVIFDQIASNIGDHYLSDNNSYIAPESGVYMFTISLTSYAGYRMQAEIVRNGVTTLANIMCYDSLTHHSSTNTVFVEVVAGDVIWVRATDDDSWLEPGLVSTFSGLLLH